MAKDDFVRVLFPGGFPVPAQGSRLRELALYLGLDLLGAQAVRPHAEIPTLGAFPLHRARITTAMAPQCLTGRRMVSQRRVAARAFHGIPAHAAEDISSAATAVHEQ